MAETPPETAAAEEPVEEPVVTLDRMLATGATYRQLDYWTRKGWIHRDSEGTPGSGQVRRWTARDLQTVTLMLALIEAGLTSQAAAQYANDAIDMRSASITSPGGVSVSWMRVPFPTIDLPEEQSA